MEAIPNNQIDSIRLCLTTDARDAAQYPDRLQMQTYLRNATGADVETDKTDPKVLRVGTLYVHDYYLIGEGER